MSGFAALFGCLSEAICARGGKGILGLVPFADALERWKQRRLDEMAVEAQAAQARGNGSPGR